MNSANELPVKPAPATGTPSVDAEHGVQLGLLDAALSSFEPHGNGEPLELVDQLHGYTQAHFMSEQLLMRLSATPHFQGHQLEHEMLLQQLDELCTLSEKGKSKPALELIEAHEKQLLAHIQSWDRAFGDHPE